MTQGNWAKWRQSNALNPPGEQIGPARRAQPIAWVHGREESRHGFIWPRSVFHKPYGAAMKAIRIFPRFLSFRGDWLLECWVGWGGGSCGEWRWRGEEGGWGIEGGLVRVGSGITQEFTLSAYTKWNEGEKSSVFLLGHVREPLAKIIIYGVGRGGERERRRERERGKGFLLFGTPVKHTEAAGRLN